MLVFSTGTTILKTSLCIRQVHCTLYMYIVYLCTCVHVGPCTMYNFTCTCLGPFYRCTIHVHVMCLYTYMYTVTPVVKKYCLCSCPLFIEREWVDMTIHVAVYNIFHPLSYGVPTLEYGPICCTHPYTHAKRLVKHIHVHVYKMYYTCACLYTMCSVHTCTCTMYMYMYVHVHVHYKSSLLTIIIGMHAPDLAVYM